MDIKISSRLLELTGPVVLTLDKQPPPLEVAQSLVGGYVQMVILQNGDQLLVNEEGLLKDLIYNPVASQMAGIKLVGNAVLLTGTAKWE